MQLFFNKLIINCHYTLTCILTDLRLVKRESTCNLKKERLLSYMVPRALLGEPYRGLVFILL